MRQVGMARRKAVGRGEGFAMGVLEQGIVSSGAQGSKGAGKRAMGWLRTREMCRSVLQVVAHIGGPTESSELFFWVCRKKFARE